MQLRNSLFRNCHGVTSSVSLFKPPARNSPDRIWRIGSRRQWATPSSVRQFITSLVGNLAASPFPLTEIKNSESLESVPRVPIPNSPYRVGFFSFDLNEKRHVHVRRERKECKVWIEPHVELAWNSGFADHEVNDILRIVCENLLLINSTYESAAKNH